MIAPLNRIPLGRAPGCPGRRLASPRHFTRNIHALGVVNRPLNRPLNWPAADGLRHTWRCLLYTSGYRNKRCPDKEKFDTAPAKNGSVQRPLWRVCAGFPAVSRKTRRPKGRPNIRSQEESKRLHIDTGKAEYKKTPAQPPSTQPPHAHLCDSKSDVYKRQVPMCRWISVSTLLR